MAGEWRDTTLGEFVTLQRGHDLTDDERLPGKVAVVGAAGQNGFHDKAMAKGPGIVVGRSGASFGQVHFCDKDFWPHNTGLYVTDFRGNDPRFAFYFLKSLDFSRYNSGSAQPSLNRNFIYPIEVQVPPPAEQRAIAHILGTLDDKIELNRRMNETLEAMARALFKSWFVDFDPVRAKHALSKVEGAEGRPSTSSGQAFPGLPKPLPDLFPDSFEDSELGEIPKGWLARPLYETARFINGAAFTSEDFCAPGEGLPVVKIAELKGGLSKQTKFSQRVADTRHLIDVGDLLYSWSGSPDTSLDAFIWTKGPGLLNQHIFKVVAPSAAQKRFVYYLLKFLRPNLVEIARNKQTTGLGHVTIADMKRLQVCWPPKAVLAAFDRQVIPIFYRTFNNVLESQNLAVLRDTLLPKLLSGEVHLNQGQKIVEEAS